MQELSIRAVLIGAVVDVLTTTIAEIPLAFYLLSQVNLLHTTQAAISAAVAAEFGRRPALYALQLAIGTASSVLGGYVAGRISVRSEFLNGALSSFLCLVIGAYSLFSGTERSPSLVKVLLLAISPALGCLGGYFARHRRERLASEASNLRVSVNI